MKILLYIAFVLVACFLAVILKEQKTSFAIFLTVGASVICIYFVLKQITPYINEIHNIFKKARLDSNYFFTILKGIAICYISKLASDICKDSGQTALASKAELIGKVALIALSIPFLKEVLDIAISLIK